MAAELKLVCPNGCPKVYLTVHASDEVGHQCPKAKDPRKRLTWLKPAPEEVK
jgi:hypothetical protein